MDLPRGLKKLPLKKKIDFLREVTMLHLLDKNE